MTSHQLWLAARRLCNSPLTSNLTRQRRRIHSSLQRREKQLYDPEKVPDRASDDVDVCIVGAGPAGLSAAIRLKQLANEKGKELRVVVLEKGAEVGSHILSGAVIEPRALNELLPDWSSTRADSHPLTQPATSSTMRFLTSSSSYPMPHPPQMSNKGNYIVSLSRFTAWLGGIAEEMGVEIYPGFAGASIVYEDGGKSVKGVCTGDVGVDKKGYMKDSFEAGMQFLAKATLIAEGAHGSLTKVLCRHFDLRKDSDPQTYGMGVKEVWRVGEDNPLYEPGKVVHTMGWPLDRHTYGGGWVYHMNEGLVSLGIVIGLDYHNPYLSPFRELQRYKHHPFISSLLSFPSAERVAYGARTLNEGGLQSIPKLHFPGGALIGCSAGFLNVPKIKGTHNAMKSGMVAAESVFSQLENENENNAEGTAMDLSGYEEAMKESWVWKELHEVRNLRPSFETSLGMWGGVLYSGVDSLLLKGRVPWTFRNKRGLNDAQKTQRAEEHKPISYPPPEPPLSTDLLTALSLTNTNHEEDQPPHLRLRSRPEEHVKTNVGEFASLLGHACPAGVYEYVDNEGEGAQGKKLVINAQNCIHCKLCDIKVPTQDIDWTVPEGGGGPGYSIT